MSDLLTKSPGGATDLEALHDFTLILPSAAGVSTLTQSLANAGADLRSVHVFRQGNDFTARCRLAKVTPEEARRLCDALIASGVALQGSVEHVVLAGTVPKTVGAP